MPEARAIIGHLVGGAWDIVSFGNVAVVTLVDAVEPKKIGSGPCGGGGVFVMPGDRGGVVTEGDNGTAMTVDGLCDDVLLGNEASQLKVRIGDVSKGVRKGDKSILNVGRKWSTPQERPNVGVGGSREPYPTHSRGRGIVWAHRNGVVRDKFSQFRGPGGQGAGQILKIIKLVSHGSGDLNTVLVSVSEALLEEGE